MVREKKVADATAKPAKKTKPTRRTGRKVKPSPYNKFIKNELERLKKAEPDKKHPERFRIAASNWATAKENPKNKSSK